MKLIYFILLFIVLSHSTLWANQSFNDLAKQCASEVHPETLQALVRVESGFNPFAIGVVKGQLKRQPKNLQEAVLVVKELERQGKNFSMGLTQINKKNLSWLGLNYETVFDPCKNLKAGATILKDCFTRSKGRTSQESLQQAFSCYYSGNFKFGFTQDFKGQPSYVQKVVNSAKVNHESARIKVPQIDTRIAITAPISIAKKSIKQNSTKKSSTPKVQPKSQRKQTQSWDVFNEL